MKKHRADRDMIRDISKGDMKLAKLYANAPLILLDEEQIRRIIETSKTIYDRMRASEELFKIEADRMMRLMQEWMDRFPSAVVRHTGHSYFYYDCDYMYEGLRNLRVDLIVSGPINTVPNVYLYAGSSLESPYDRTDERWAQRYGTAERRHWKNLSINPFKDDPGAFELKEFSELTSRSLMLMQSLVLYLDEIQDLPVECRNVGAKRKTVHEKRPWLSETGVTIRTLGQIQQGNSSKSPHNAPQRTGSKKSYHYRRAHNRTLRSERYKDHPAYQVENGIAVPATYVGDPSFQRGNVEYRVSLPKGTEVKSE